MAVTAQGSLPCTKCKAVLPEELFDRNRAAPHRNGRHQWCKACRSASLRARYESDPEKYRDFARWGSMKHRFGLTRAQYESMAAEQGDVCAICNRPDEGRRLSIDHDHACCPGEKTCGSCIRGLLCNSCNRLLGLAEDNVDRLLAAVAYLRG